MGTQSVDKGHVVVYPEAMGNAYQVAMGIGHSMVPWDSGRPASTIHMHWWLAHWGWSHEQSSPLMAQPVLLDL